MFAISYRNPGSEQRDFGFDDYLANGPLAALDVVQAITGSPKGRTSRRLCLGGTLAALRAGYLGGRRRRPAQRR